MRSARNKVRRKENSKNPMDFDRYRDDMLNTGVIAALLGGFALTNSWEMDNSGSLLDTTTYVLAIIAVHSCTCSVLSSAFLYRSLTKSDPQEAVRWMESHTTIAALPFLKFVIGTVVYMTSVILVALKELEDVPAARLFTFVAGIFGFCSSLGILGYLSFDSPANYTRDETEEDTIKNEAA